MTHERWITVDFRPAPAGYRLAYLDAQEDPPVLTIEPMPGWLVEEHQVRHSIGDDWRSTDERRAVAAEHGWWGPEVEASSHELLWRVLFPGEPDPTPEEITSAAAGAQRRQEWLERKS